MSCDLETVDFGLLYPAILAIAPGTPIPYMNFYIGNAVADLALRLKNITSNFTQDAQAGVTDYPLEVPEGYTVAFVESVCVNGYAHKAAPAECRTAPIEDAPCTVRLPDSCPFPEAQERVFNVSSCGRMLSIFPAPTEDKENGIVVRMSLLPSRTACAMPKEIYDRYATEIIDMVLSQVLLKPDLKTSPNTLALVNRRLERGIRRARQDAAAKHSESGYTRIHSPVEDWIL